MQQSPEKFSSSPSAPDTAAASESQSQETLNQDNQSPNDADATGAVSGLPDQQEAFCQAYVYYANAAHAAKAAGYAPASARQQGHRLLTQPWVTTRIAEIRQALGTQGCRDTETLLGKLENVYNRAIEDHHFVAAARSVEIQCRLAGLMPSLQERLAANNPKSEKTAGNRDSRS